MIEKKINYYTEDITKSCKNHQSLSAIINRSHKASIALSNHQLLPAIINCTQEASIALRNYQLP
jgi:hypothetical protein